MLSNGNILFAHQFSVKLITSDKKILWHYEPPPGYEVHTAVPSAKTASPLDSSNSIQAFELTRTKQVVWALRQWTPPTSLGPATVIQLLDEPSAPENMHLGGIQ
jgi:hypothetical protein